MRWIKALINAIVLLLVATLPNYASAQTDQPTRVTPYRFFGHGSPQTVVWVGDLIAVGNSNGVLLYDHNDLKKEPVLLALNDTPVFHLAVSRNGKWLAAYGGQSQYNVGTGGRVTVWDVTSRKQIMSAVSFAVKLQFSPDDSQLIGYTPFWSRYYDRVVTVWDVATGNHVAHAQNMLLMRFQSGAFRIGQKLNVMGLTDQDGLISLWALDRYNFFNSKGQVPPQSTNIANMRPKDYIEIAHSGELLSVRIGTTIWIVNALRRLFVDRIDLSPNEYDDPLIKSYTDPGGYFYPDFISRLEIRDDRTHIVERYPNRTAAILPGSRADYASFSPDDRSIAIVDMQAQTTVYDIESGQAKFSLQGHEGKVLQVHFSPDSRWIATSGADRTVRIWDAQTGVLQQGWVQETTAGIAFSPDSASLLIAETSGRITTANFRTGQKTLNANIGSISLPRINFTKLDRVVLYTSQFITELSLIDGTRRNLLEGVPVLYQSRTSLCENYCVLSVGGDSTRALLVKPGSGSDTFVYVVMDLVAKQIIKTDENSNGTEKLLSTDGKWLAYLWKATSTGLHCSGWIDFTSLDNPDISSLSFVSSRGWQCLSSVEFSPSGKYIAAVQQEGTVAVWKIDE